MYDIPKVLPSDLTEFDTNIFLMFKTRKTMVRPWFGFGKPGPCIDNDRNILRAMDHLHLRFSPKKLVEYISGFFGRFFTILHSLTDRFYLIEILSHVPLSHSLAAISRCKHYLFVLYHYLVYTYYFYKFTTPINMSLSTIYARYQQ